MFYFNNNNKEESICQENTIMVAPQVDDPSKLVDDGFTLVKPKFKPRSVAHGDKGYAALMKMKGKEPNHQPDENKFSPLLEFANYATELEMMPDDDDEEMTFYGEGKQGNKIMKDKTVQPYETYPKELFSDYEDDEALFYASTQIKKMKLGKVKRNKHRQDNKNLKTLRAIVNIYRNSRLNGHTKYVQEMIKIFKEANKIQAKVFENVIELTRRRRIANTKQNIKKSHRKQCSRIEHANLIVHQELNHDPEHEPSKMPTKLTNDSTTNDLSPENDAMSIDTNNNDNNEGLPENFNHNNVMPTCNQCKSQPIFPTINANLTPPPKITYIRPMSRRS